MKFWYSKDKKKINEYKYLIMLDLGLEDLKSLSSKDKLVNKFMDNLEELNEDPVFREYMTKEEDMRKCHNSDLRIAREEGIKENAIETAKKLLNKMSVQEIHEVTGLSLEEIEELNEDPVFHEYMTKEEDMRKCHNSDLRIAREEGINEGAKQANIETAKKMIAKGKTIKEIQEFTELSLEEIEKLKQN